VQGSAVGKGVKRQGIVAGDKHLRERARGKIMGRPGETRRRGHWKRMRDTSQGKKQMRTAGGTGVGKGKKGK